MDNQNVKTHRSHLQPLLKLNAADKEKYRKLGEQRSAPSEHHMCFHSAWRDRFLC